MGALKRPCASMEGTATQRGEKLSLREKRVRRVKSSLRESSTTTQYAEEREGEKKESALPAKQGGESSSRPRGKGLYKFRLEKERKKTSI